MVISTETHESQDFVKPTIMWILVIFSKLVELILISLDQIHYYQVLDKIHWQITQGNVCVWCLSYITESSEILYKIDHDLTMIDRDIYVTTPVPFYVNFQFFICWLFISSKQVEKWWDFDGLLSIYRHRLKIWSWSEFGPGKIRFWSEFTGSFSTTPCRGGIKIGLTLKIEFSTHRKVMDKPSWGSSKLVTNFEFSFKKWPFVTASVAFYVNFPKNHDFDDLDKLDTSPWWIFWIWCVQTVQGYH